MRKNSNNPILTGWKPKAAKQTIKVPNDSEWGVDWVNLRVDVDPSSIDLSSSLWTVSRSGKLPEPGKVYDCYYLRLPFGETTVDVTLSIDAMRAYLKFNPSTALYGKSKKIFPPNALRALVSNLLDETYSFFIPAFDFVDGVGTIHRDPNWANQVWITRLDCARNFIIDDPFRFKNAIYNASPKNKKLKAKFEDGDAGWGVVNQTRTVGRDKVYDKDEELMRHNADEILSESEGTCFRFETQLQSSRLDTFGLRQLSQITDESVWFALEQRWLACRWNVTFGEPGTVAKSIAKLTPAEKSGLLGYMAMHQLGFQNEITTSGHRKYGTLARSFGFTLGAPLEDQGEAMRIADIFAGRIVNLQ